MLKNTLLALHFVLAVALSGHLAHAATITNISDSAAEVSPILPGLVLPQVSLKSADNKEVSLHTLLQQKPTVLVVYRGGWCPYCSQQLANIKKIEQELIDKGFQIIAVSPDSPEKLQQSTISSANYQLLSDDQLELTQALGLAFYLDDEVAKAYRNKLGVNFVTLDGEQKVALPVPAVFVLDTDARVHFQYANPNYKVRLSEQLLLAAADSVQ
ncbi:peroxiredoxin-like family protein [Pseudoalteromonas sp. T1lg48]|uniref:peroxiredoxin-like family protein n=1 Tax=Pseudoalteromonas sp. T1lg48 TaxID=2077100 RepID=UPI000CF6F406|nr:peroxiredoxin-like family protein [Pseudoalteromonas sp. T1lg48]